VSIVGVILLHLVLLYGFWLAFGFLNLAVYGMQEAGDAEQVLQLVFSFFGLHCS